MTTMGGLFRLPRHVAHNSSRSPRIPSLTYPTSPHLHPTLHTFLGVVLRGSRQNPASPPPYFIPFTVLLFANSHLIPMHTMFSSVAGAVPCLHLLGPFDAPGWGGRIADAPRHDCTVALHGLFPYAWNISGQIRGVNTVARPNAE